MLFLSSTNRSVKESSDAMENMLFRTAFDKSFYQMQKALRKYLKSEKINQKLLNDFIEIQTKLLSPFCPHIAEEIWSKIGNKKLVSVEKWPVANDGEINLELEKEEQQVDQSVDDVRNIFRIVKDKQGKEPQKVYLYVIPKELILYKESKDMISKSLNVEVLIFAVNDPKKHDPENKASKAKPGKPAIFVE
jgi:leucyl-tRNA synthetase